MVYGRMTNEAGGQMPGVWVRLVQGSNSALALTDADGNFVFYDGQNCLPADGLQACSTGSAWTFANGGNVSSKLEVLGDGGSASGSPTWPTSKTTASVRSGSQTFASFTSPTLPSYTFSIAKSSAYNRDWKFGP